VSYALPALIAVGLVIDSHRPASFFLRRWLRSVVKGRALRKLQEIQPSSGGFLEAVPLTSFVTMSLVPQYGHQHPVADRGLAFLRASVREDGSWPIDANLSVWLTTGAVAALSEAGQEMDGESLCPWLLSAQHMDRHVYTNAAPGGWAWTDLPGGVPDADDTAGAILALIRLGERGAAVESGVKWLLDLQNSDGGWPTFCRGWGRLPFDRSAPDLTAHALRALHAFDPQGRRADIGRAKRRGLQYLYGQARGDGSWLPLWFGNQAARDMNNPVLGTARVLRALSVLEPDGEAFKCGCRFLADAQNADGGWGGEAGVASTTEETALAISALADALQETKVREALQRGVFHLVERVESGRWSQPAPIGLYFAKLWYSEDAYPVIWTVEALGRVLRRLDAGSGTNADLRVNSEDCTAHAS
jgi:squalene-hopene/tetraprenyl-beta-curcumene cyclase